MAKLKLVLFASVCFSTIPQFALAEDACQSGQKCWADIEETEYGTPVHKTLAGGTNIHTTEAGEDWRAVRANGGGGKIGVASVKTLGDGVTVTTDGEEADGLQVIGGGEIEFNGGSVTTNGAGAFAVVSGTVGEGGADMGAVLSVDRSAIRSAYVGAAALSGGIATIQNTNITINQQAVADENANTRVGAGPYGLVASGTAVGENGAGAGKTGAFLGAAGVDVTVDGIATADSRSAAVAAFDKGVVSLVTPIAGQLNSIDVLRDKTAGLRADAGPVEKTAGAIYSSGNLLVQTSGNHSPGVVAANVGRVELVGDGKVAYVSTIGADAPALFAQGDGSLLTVERFNVETYGDNSPALRLEGKSQANILSSTLSSGASASVEVTGGAPQLALVNSHLDKNNGTLFDVKGGSFASIYAESSSMAGRIVTASDSATDLTLGQGSVWNVSGSSNLGDLFSTNSSIQFARPVGNPAQAASYKTLTVSGDYFADNARLGMNVYLAGDNAPSDHLVVNGSTAGSTVITVNPTGGTGAQTRDGIEIVHVNGQSEGLFELSNPNHAVNAGLYAYTLHKGNVTKPGDGNWYLASQRLPDNGQVDPKHPTPVNPDAPVRYSAGVPVYEGYMQNMMALSKAPTLQQRTGNRYVDGTAKPATADDMADPNSGVNGYGVWARVEGGHNRFDPKHSTTGMKQTINTYIMQAGVDGQFYEGEDGRLIAGITGQYGRALGKVKSVHGDGDITTNAWSLGATATWYGNSGFYVDTQGQLSWFDNDLDSRTANTNLSKGRKARGYMASIEAGQRFGLDQNWSLTPQAQLSWSRIKADSFDDVFALHVAPGTDDSLTGRLGLAADYRNSWLGSNGQMVDTTVYGIANVYQEFKSGTHITLAGVDFKTDTDKTWGGLGAGGTYAWDNNTYAVYGEGSVNTGLNNFGKNYAVKGSLGFRVKW